MRCKTMLLGGAVALVLSGAAYAQAQQTAPQANPGTDQISAGSAGTQATTGSETTTSTTTTTTHHHYHHHHYHHHYYHHTKTAARGSSTGEKQATRDLNQQQLQGGTMQATSAGGSTGSEGQMNNSATPQATSAPMTSAPSSTGAQPASAPQSGTQPGGANGPSNATYTQPQGSPAVQPGNAGYQQPQSGQSPNGYQTVPQDNQPGAYMSAPGAMGPAGSQGNPVTPEDQKGPTPQPDNSSNPGPSS